MSTASLLDFCNKLDSTLRSPKGSQIYRDLVANKRVHVFKFSSKIDVRSPSKGVTDSCTF